MSTRTVRLEELQQSTKKWADNRRKKIEKIVASHKKMLKSRGTTASKASEIAEELVANEIADFLRSP
jgi:hypothetical protein